MKEIERQMKNKKEIQKLLKEVNYIYQGFYHFILQEVNGYIDRYAVVDEFEEFDYGSQDFDNCFDMLQDGLRKIFNNSDLYIEEEVKGRWNVVNI